MQYSLYDIKEKIKDYLRSNNITIKEDTSDSDFPFVCIDISMNLNASPQSESGRSFNWEINKNKVVGVTMPFILTAFIYGGNNENIQKNKANIEDLFLNTFYLLHKWIYDSEIEIQLKGQTDARWIDNPILDRAKIDSTKIELTIGGWARYV